MSPREAKDAGNYYVNQAVTTRESRVLIHARAAGDGPDHYVRSVLLSTAQV